ncbi:MAG: glycosyltransferase family 39 protein [bacterium]|nr:glycosyltransferase family 39 protein [bacterium]
MSATHRPRLLWIVLGIGLAARLIIGLSQDARIETYAGGDSLWYWRNAYVLASGATIREIDGQIYDVSRLTVPPVYLLTIGAPQTVLPPEAAVIAVRILQAVLSTITAYCAFRMAVRVSGRVQAGLIAAGLLAFSPAFAIEAAQITTETVFMALLAGGLAVTLDSVAVSAVNRPHAWRGWVLAGGLFGLAALTRAVALAFPLMLAVVVVIALGFRRGAGRALVLLAAASLVILSWTAYNLVRWDRWVLAGEGLPAFLYIGATGWDDPVEVDARLMTDARLMSDGQPMDDPNGTPTVGSPTQQDFAQGAAAAIGADPAGYLARRVGELSGAALQPHGTAFFAGESLRDLAVGWLRDDRSITGLVALTHADQFWIKLALYLFHYGTLILGAAGLWQVMRACAWRLALPLAAYIGYTLAVHLVLLALPRYLFPTLIAWAVLAGCAWGVEKGSIINGKVERMKNRVSP